MDIFARPKDNDISKYINDYGWVLFKQYNTAMQGYKCEQKEQWVHITDIDSVRTSFAPNFCTLQQFDDRIRMH